jgi:hypothetical protein
VKAGEAGKRLGMTVQALGQWAMRPEAPVRLRGKLREYQWPAFPRWRERELTRQARDEARPKDRNEAEERLASAKAQLAELDLEEKRQMLCTRDQYDAAVGGLLERIRGVALALGPKWGPRCVGLRTTVEAVARLEEAGRDFLHELQAAE